MSDRLTELLTLPARERREIALTLFDSLKDQNCDAVEEAPLDPDLIAEIRRRNQAYDSGTVVCRTHEEVMASVRAETRSK